MAKKPVITNLQDLRRWFENTAAQFESSAWNLYAGFKENLAERTGMLTKQPDANKSIADSFEWLEDAIEMASYDGGEFTIYMPNPKHSVHGFKQFFKVDKQGAQSAGLDGFPTNPAAMGYITREEFALQQQMWELRRENEDLKAAINGPANFWQGLAQQAIENGTGEKVVSRILGVIDNVLAGIALKSGAMRPQISVNGLDGQEVKPITAPKSLEGEENGDYPDEMYQFADYIFDQIGNDPETQRKFWTNLKTVAIQQPALIQQLLQ